LKVHAILIEFAVNHASGAKCFPEPVSSARFDPCVQFGQPDEKAKKFYKSIMKPLKAIKAKEITGGGTFGWMKKWRLENIVDQTGKIICKQSSDILRLMFSFQRSANGVLLTSSFRCP
jgi:hypothetical protein